MSRALFSSSLLPLCTLSLWMPLTRAADPVDPLATRPATTAATHPATVPTGSLDSPRDALKWFATALRDGDVPRLKKVMLAANETEDRMIGAMGDMSAALASLHQAAMKAFGAPAAEQFTDDASAHFDRAVARINAAEITVTGDAATVKYPDDRPYELKKVKSEWRLPAAQFLQGVSETVLDRRVAEMKVQTRIINDMTREIAAGKHRNAEAAALAWRGKMMSVVGATGPAAQPTTVPATRAK